MNQETRKEAMYQAGRAAALELQKAAPMMTGTQIIDREQDVPAFDPQKDYTNWDPGSPVSDEGQVWTLIQPHNAANSPSSRWGL